MNQNLQNVFPNVDAVYTSLTTSAAVDAYCFGLKVITALDPKSLNLSPLRQKNDVDFVRSTNELENVLMKLISNNYNKRVTKKFFDINNDLKEWKRLFF